MRPQQFSKKKLFASLEIGKVTEGELLQLSVWELKALFGLFYQQVFGIFVSFRNNLMPKADEDFSWVVCIPPFYFLNNATKLKKEKEDVFSERGAFLRALCEVFDFCEKNQDPFIVLTAGEINATKKNRDNSKGNILTSLEYLILREFIRWLTGLHLDCGNAIITSSKSQEGEVSVFICLDDDGSFCLEHRPLWLTFFNSNFIREAIR